MAASHAAKLILRLNSVSPVSNRRADERLRRRICMQRVCIPFHPPFPPSACCQLRPPSTMM